MTAPVLDDLDLADDGLVFYHPVNDEEIDETYLPWGTVAAASSDDRRIRVCNTSADYTATGVVVAFAAPLDPGAVSAAAAHYASADGATFLGRLTLGDLLPHAISAPITLRRVTPPGAPAGDQGFLLTATATEWIPAAGDPTGGAGGGYDPDAVDAPPGDEGTP